MIFGRDNRFCQDCIIVTRGYDFREGQRWRSFDAVEYATLEWVDWFNNRRLLEPIGNIPPAEAEANYYATLEEPRMAA